jgi:ceramide glucosyltransferase
VTILKPLKGVDDDLEENLRSFAALDYPDFQLVLGAQNPSDPALEVARRLRAGFPEVDITIVAGATDLGRNPKVTNLATMARSARHDLWLVSDSNVRVGPSYLRDTVAELRPDVGLVTNLFVGIGEESVGAALENLHLSTWIAGGLGSIQVLTRRACVVGKSMLFPRTVLDRIGGWNAFADILAEDYVIGVRVHELGLRTTTSPHVIRTINRSWPLRRFINRHLRWAQIRRRLSPFAYAFEPLLNPLPWALLAGVAGAPWLAAAIVAGKIVLDAAQLRAVRGTSMHLAPLLLVPVKDLLMLGVWAVGAFRRRVWWRGNVLFIGPGSELIDAPSDREGQPAEAPA